MNRVPSAFGFVPFLALLVCIDLFQASWGPPLIGFVGWWLQLTQQWGAGVMLVPLLLLIATGVYVLVQALKGLCCQDWAGLPGVPGASGMTAAVVGFLVFVPSYWNDAYIPGFEGFFTPPFLAGVLRNVCALLLLWSIRETEFPRVAALGKRFIEGVATLPFRRLALISAGVFLLQTLLISRGTFGGIPHVQDEMLYDWQARQYCTGNVVENNLPYPEFLKMPFTGVKNGAVIPHYPPGWPVLLAAAHVAGDAFWLAGLLGLLFWGGLAGWARHVYSDAESRWIMVLAAFCPFLVLQSSSLFSHLPMGVAFWLTLVGVLAAQTHPKTGGLLAGLSAGYGVLIRPLDGICLVMTLVLLVLHPFCRRRLAFSALVAMLTGGVLCFGVLLYFNGLATGDPFLTAYELVWDDQKKLGFGHFNPFFNEPHSFLIALQRAWKNICGLLTMSLGTSLPLFLILILPLSSFFSRDDRPAEFDERFPFSYALAVLAGITFIAYAGYFFTDFCLGPRFYFPLLPLVLCIFGRKCAALVSDVSPVFATSGESSASPVLTVPGTSEIPPKSTKSQVSVVATPLNIAPHATEIPAVGALAAKVVGFQVLFWLLFQFPLTARVLATPTFWGSSPIRMTEAPGAPRGPAVVLIRGQLPAMWMCQAKMAGLGLPPEFIVRTHSWPRADWRALSRALDAWAIQFPEKSLTLVGFQGFLGAASGRKEHSRLASLPQGDPRPAPSSGCLTHGYEIFLNHRFFEGEPTFLCFHDLGPVWRKKLRAALPHLPMFYADYATATLIPRFSPVPDSDFR